MATDNDLAFDTARCDIGEVPRIPCENLLTNPNVSAAPPPIADTGPQLDEPPDNTGDGGGGFACPTILPTVLASVPLTKVANSPKLYYQFSQGEDCSFILEIAGEYVDPFEGFTGNFGSLSFSNSCVRLGPTSPTTVYLDEIPNDPEYDDETPSITYRFVRLPGCAYDLEISGTFRDGVTESLVVYTDIDCVDDETVGTPVLMVFKHGILARLDYGEMAVLGCPPCCNLHLSACNPEAGIPSILHVTFNYTGGSFSFDIEWAIIGCCVGLTEGWCYENGSEDKPDIPICEGMDFRDFHLCCNPSIPSWDVEFVIFLDGVQQTYSTSPGDPVVTISEDPMLLQIGPSGDLTGVSCVLENLVITIAA